MIVRSQALQVMSCSTIPKHWVVSAALQLEKLSVRFPEEDADSKDSIVLLLSRLVFVGAKLPVGRTRAGERALVTQDPALVVLPKHIPALLHPAASHWSSGRAVCTDTNLAGLRSQSNRNSFLITSPVAGR